jgi:hypothetical protein
MRTSCPSGLSVESTMFGSMVARSSARISVRVFRSKPVLVTPAIAGASRLEAQVVAYIWRTLRARTGSKLVVFRHPPIRFQVTATLRFCQADRMFEVIIKSGGGTITVLRGAKLATATEAARQHARTRRGVFIRNQETGALEQIS